MATVHNVPYYVSSASSLNVFQLPSRRLPFKKNAPFIIPHIDFQNTKLKNKNAL